MNIKRLINETIISSNGDMSRGLKNQLSIFSAFTSEDLEQKMNFLKQAGIPVHSYFGIRILEFKLSDINAVINANQAKLANYKNNPQELVKDLRSYELKTNVNTEELEEYNEIKFLQKFGFTSEQLSDLNNNAAIHVLNTIEKNKNLVSTNINYLMGLGVKNIQDVFLEYYDLFLLDNSNFVSIFNKYDRDDLVEKIAKNVAIVEYL